MLPGHCREAADVRGHSKTQNGIPHSFLVYHTAAIFLFDSMPFGGNSLLLKSRDQQNDFRIGGDGIVEIPEVMVDVTFVRQSHWRETLNIQGCCFHLETCSYNTPRYAVKGGYTGFESRQRKLTRWITQEWLETRRDAAMTVNAVVGRQVLASYFGHLGY